MVVDGLDPAHVATDPLELLEPVAHVGRPVAAPALGTRAVAKEVVVMDGFMRFLSRNKETIAVIGGLAVAAWWVKKHQGARAGTAEWIPTFPGAPRAPKPLTGYDFAAYSPIQFR